MKPFFLKGALFVAILVSYFLINYSINKSIATKNPPVLEATTLIMGDSHIMTALDPDQFYKAKNVAQEAEPYAATYFKLRELIKYNRIDTLILGFSLQNLSEFNDQKFVDRFWSDELFDRIYPIVTWNDLKNYEINTMSLVRSWVKNMLLFPKQEQHPYLGKFSASKGMLSTIKQKPTAAINRHFYYNDHESGISLSCQYYLDAIIQIAHDHHIKLILVNTPLHASYRTLVPIKFAKDFQQMESALTKKGVYIIDLSSYPLPDDQFKDYDHVNGKGVAVVTGEVISRIKKSK